MLVFFFFFFKQKTAYEMLRSLVGSEMCIRDRISAGFCTFAPGTYNMDTEKPLVPYISAGKLR